MGAGMEEEGGESIGHIRAVIAHGTLMIAAFALLLPLGALLARHKWAFGRKQVGCLPMHAVTWCIGDPIVACQYPSRKLLHKPNVIYDCLSACSGLLRPGSQAYYKHTLLYISLMRTWQSIH